MSARDARVRPRRAFGLGGGVRVVAALLSVCALGACRSAPIPQRTDPVRDTVSAELSGSAVAVERRLRAFFNNGTGGVQQRFSPSDRLSLFEAVPAYSPPDAQQVGLPPDQTLARYASNNPALQRYVRSERSERALDVYLFQPTGPHFWPSEYEADGRVLPFSTDFIVRIVPVGAERTEIEIIEVLPRVQFGEKWAFAKHGVGIGRVSDIRAVAPTTRDRMDLLTRIVDAVRQSAAH